MTRVLTITFLLSILLIPGVSAQDVDTREGFYGRFDYATYRLLALAEDLPEDVFSWKPNEGAMSVEHVFMHLIRYNYYYPSVALQQEMPSALPVESFEQMTGKENVLKYLQGSIDHVREVVKGMSVDELNQKVMLYGRNTPAYNVFTQLEVHMGEHLGQLMAYSRMNDIIPPWSRKKAGS